MKELRSQIGQINQKSDGTAREIILISASQEEAKQMQSQSVEIKTETANDLPSQCVEEVQCSPQVSSEEEDVTDQVFQERNDGICIYHDHARLDSSDGSTPELIVTVKHETTELQPFNRKCYEKGPLKGQAIPTFNSREELLDYEVKRRMEAMEHLPDKERYTGFKLSQVQKVKLLVGKDIDPELKRKSTTPLKLNYSAKNVYNMTNHMQPSKEICEKLNIAENETHKLATKLTWAFNSSLNGYTFIDEEGETVEIRNATTSSNDRTTTNICMMRRIDDVETGKTIAYTGRPDTRDKAIEQIEFMFRSERDKKELMQGEDGSYTLTYAINNLLSPLTGIGKVSFDEKEATYKEQAIFEELSKETLTIDGEKVRIKPIYFSQPFNQTTNLNNVMTDSHSGKKASKKINKKGYETLLPMAEEHLKTMEDGNHKELLAGAIQILQDKKTRSSLQPEEELFNRAVICQALNIQLVIHCKSSTDRTVLGLATATVAHQWSKLNLDAIRNEKQQIFPHLILQNKAAKELIAGHCLAGHQVTRVSRTCEGVVNNHTIGTHTLGFDWASNPVAGRILPERYTKTNHVSGLKRAGAGALSTLGFVANSALALPIWLVGAGVTHDASFNPIFIKPGTSPFAKRLINPDSSAVGAGEGRSLLKPKGMVKL